MNYLAYKMSEMYKKMPIIYPRAQGNIFKSLILSNQQSKPQMYSNYKDIKEKYSHLRSWN